MCPCAAAQAKLPGEESTIAEHLTVCAVCKDASTVERGTSEQIVVCNGCGIAVHIGCYEPVWHNQAETAMEEDGDFLCPGCSNGPPGPCAFCLHEG
eukprot:4675324-Prymnesium_polylepis.1